MGVGACSDSPSAPSGGAGLLTTAGGTPLGRPTLHPNSTKYRDTGRKPKRARAGSATLTTRALLDAAGRTVLELSTGDLDAGTAPGRFRHIQVKAFSPDGRLLFTDNHRATSGGTATFTYEGLPRGFVLQVQGAVTGIDGNRTDVVTVTDTVRLRPDLQLARLDAPSRAAVNSPVNITAVVRELNGDLGARASCVLYVGGAATDRADHVWVDAGGTVSCAFTHRFGTPGTVPIRVALENVSPADADASNNEASTSIEISGGSTFYYEAVAASYDQHDVWQRYSTTVQAADGSWGQEIGGESSTGGPYQTTYVRGDMPGKGLTFPLARLEVSQSTGGRTLHGFSAEQVNFTSEWKSSWATDRCTSLGAAADGPYLLFHLCTRTTTSGGKTTSTTSFTYAYNAGDVTYHSAYYARLWDKSTGQNYSYHYNYDYRVTRAPLVPFGSDLSFSVSIADDGAHYGVSKSVAMRSHVHSAEVPYACNDYTLSWGTYRSCFGRKVTINGVTGHALGAPE